MAYLCHASCEITGQAYSVGGGRVSRLFLGMTTGITEPDLSTEMIAERIDEIESTDELRHPLVGVIGGSARSTRRERARATGAALLEQGALHLARRGLRERLVPDHELLGDLPLRHPRRDQAVDHRVERRGRPPARAARPSPAARRSCRR